MMSRPHELFRIPSQLFYLVCGAMLLATTFASHASDVQLIPETVTYQTGSEPEAIAVADVNGDGIKDLITANYASDSVSVLLGKSDGSYQPRASYSVGNGPVDIQVADMDGDGNLDIAVVNSADDTVTVLYGDGTGKFGSAVTLDVGASDPVALLVADLNGDGHQDLVTANYSSSSISILYGAGGRSFKTATLIGTVGAPTSIAIGDMTGAGNDDIVVGGNDVMVLINDGSGSFKSAGTFNPQYLATSIALADLNRDGHLDVIGVDATHSELWALPGSATGKLDDSCSSTSDCDIKQVAIPNGAAKVLMLDVNGDGRQDAVVSYSTSTTISLFESTAAGNFLGRADYNVGEALNGLAVLKSESGEVPYFVGASVSNSNVVLVDGSLALPLGGPFFETVGSSPTGIASGDFNGDGQNDIVTANSLDSTVSLLLGNGDGTFGVHNDFTVGDGPRRIRAADLNKDGNTDVVTVNTRANTVTVLDGTGAGVLGQRTDYAVGTSPVDVAVGDLNHDGYQDIVTADAGSNTVSVLLSTGVNTYAPAVTIPVPNTPYAVAIGNFNGDTSPDIAVTEYVGGKVAVLLNDGSGGFSLSGEYAVGSQPDAIAVGDLNGDKYDDIVTANYGSNNVSVLLNQAGAGFAAQKTYAVGNKPQTIALADIVNAGHLDIATASAQNETASVLRGDGKGGFSGRSETLIGHDMVDLTVADFDDDGLNDIAGADQDNNTVSLLLSGTDGSGVTASDLSYTLDTGSASSLQGTLSASTVLNHTVTFQIISQPQHGTLKLTDSELGSFTYTPASGYTGSDSFSYEATDGSLVSNTATVSITVDHSSGGGTISGVGLLLLGLGAGLRKLNGASRRRQCPL